MATQNKVNNSLGTTSYAVICGGTTASGAVQPVASVGTSGQVLKSNGAAALPSFQDITGQGALVQIGATQTASNSATIDFTSGIDTTYDTYLVVCSNVVPASATGFFARFSVDGGSNYLSTNYQSGSIFHTYNSATVFNDNSTSGIQLSGGQVTTSTVGISVWVWFYGLATSNQPKVYAIGYWNNGGPVSGRYITKNTTTSGVNALRFAMNTGNISSGSFTLFGLRK